MRTSPNSDSARSSPRKRVFTRYMQEKLVILFILITLALLGLVYVIYHIIDENQDSYNQIVLSQQEYDSRVLPYRRGDIVDRNGTYLATTEKVYNLILDPKQIMSDEENYLETTVEALCECYGYDKAEIRSLITENPSRAYLRYSAGRQLSFDQKEAFEELESSINENNAKENSKARVKGVWFEDEYRRVYPNNSLACNVIGFATSDGGSGTGGIEQSYNDYLTGTNGREYGYLNEDSSLERVIKSAINGDTIVSTIDVNIQNVVEKYIRQWEVETGSDRSAAIVMNPKNGEVLAMASNHMYDLNDPRSVAQSYTDEEIYELGLSEAVTYYKNHPKEEDVATIRVEEVPYYYSEDEIRSFGLQVAWNQEWRNFCISDTYEPGSTAKIFTVSTALEEGVLNGYETFLCDGFQEVGGWVIRCVNRNGHGPLTVQEALMQSCNDVMMQIASMIGRTRFTRYQRLFGFGQKTGIDLPGEADTSHLIYTEDTMKPSDLATNSFGQNFNCTMIQMAAAYCSVINGGSYYEPHVVRQILNEQGSVLKRIEPKLVRETVSENTSNYIKEALYRTVEEGTGSAAAVMGYQIAGKTGTAEKYPRGTGDYLVSFIGFAPAYDPEVLVYVIIDTPHVADQPHSTFASNIFSQIMNEILPYMNIFPEVTEEITEDITGILPDDEGIAAPAQPVEEEEVQEIPQETRVYETEEYIQWSDEDEYELPDNVLAEENILEIESGNDSDYFNGSDSSVSVNPQDNWEAEEARLRTEEDEEDDDTDEEETVDELIVVNSDA